ncbi:MAG: Holliday junction resolvase RuvX [Candidatus Dojkabacteria bacterium]|jgi:putative Holliday junction resolvase
MKVTYPILAIDYGDKHFGLAISDTKGILAQPLDTISISQNRGINNVIKDILDIAEEQKAKTILVGMPQEFRDQYKKTTDKIKIFINRLKDHTKIPIITYDESFSTTWAQNMLISSGQTTKKSRRKIDSIAATVFLQEFLNSNNRQNGKR